IAFMIRSPPIPTLLPYTTLFRSYETEHTGLRHDHVADVQHIVAALSHCNALAHAPRHRLLVQRQIAVVVMQHGEGFLDHVVALRSEEHTSELQSRENLVCRLLLE